MNKKCKCGVFKSGPAKDFNNATMNIKRTQTNNPDIVFCFLLVDV